MINLYMCAFVCISEFSSKRISKLSVLYTMHKYYDFFWNLPGLSFFFYEILANLTVSLLFLFPVLFLNYKL